MAVTDAEKEKAKRVLLWLGFSVFFALSPLLINFLLVRGEPGFKLAKIYDRGELFLISTALCADAVGRLFNHKGKASFLAIFCFMAAVYLMFSNAFEYGTVAKDVYLGHPIDSAISSDSWKQFLGTVFAGLGAVLSEG